MSGTNNGSEVKSGDKSALAVNTNRPAAATAAEAVASKSKVGRKPKIATTANVRYFAGELKEGVPVLSKEFPNEQTAKVDSLTTGKPFFAIEANIVKVTGIDPKDGNKFDFVLVPVSSERR